MKRRIGIKRRLMAQRLINKRRFVCKNFEILQRDSAAPFCLATVQKPTTGSLSVSPAA